MASINSRKFEESSIKHTRAGEMPDASKATYRRLAADASALGGIARQPSFFLPVLAAFGAVFGGGIGIYYLWKNGAFEKLLGGSHFSGSAEDLELSDT